MNPFIVWNKFVFLLGWSFYKHYKSWVVMKSFKIILSLKIPVLTIIKLTDNINDIKSVIISLSTFVVFKYGVKSVLEKKKIKAGWIDQKIWKNVLFDQEHYETKNRDGRPKMSDRRAVTRALLKNYNQIMASVKTETRIQECQTDKKSGFIQRSLQCVALKMIHKYRLQSAKLSKNKLEIFCHSLKFYTRLYIHIHMWEYKKK